MKKKSAFDRRYEKEEQLLYEAEHGLLPAYNPDKQPLNKQYLKYKKNYYGYDRSNEVKAMDQDNNQVLNVSPPFHPRKEKSTQIWPLSR